MEKARPEYDKSEETSFRMLMHEFAQIFTFIYNINL